MAAYLGVHFFACNVRVRAAQAGKYRSSLECVKDLIVRPLSLFRGMAFPLAATPGAAACASGVGAGAGVGAGVGVGV